MSFYLKAYLVLERLMIEADDQNNPFADILRDSLLDDLWYDKLSPEELELLKSRINPGNEVVFHFSDKIKDL